MTLNEKYDELIQRMRLPANAEKYRHLIISADKSDAEEAILNLNERIKSNFDLLCKNIDCNVDKESLKSNITRFLKNFEVLLDEEDWSKE